MLVKYCEVGCAQGVGDDLAWQIYKVDRIQQKAYHKFWDSIRLRLRLPERNFFPKQNEFQKVEVATSLKPKFEKQVHLEIMIDTGIAKSC
jgi:hypothetical protein